MAPLEPRLAAVVRLSRMTKRHFLSHQYPVLVCPPSKMSIYMSWMDNGYTILLKLKTLTVQCTFMYTQITHTFLCTDVHGYR
jgi:hypothetical protein